MMKYVYGNILKDENVIHQILKAVAGIDVAVGQITCGILCSNFREDEEMSLNVDYCIYEGKDGSQYTIGIFPGEFCTVDPIKHLNTAADCYTQLEYGYVYPRPHTTIALMLNRVRKSAYAPCKENEFILSSFGDESIPDIGELFSVALGDLKNPVTELGKAVYQCVVVSEGEDYFEYADE